jgi:hypothetical protein
LANDFGKSSLTKPWDPLPAPTKGDDAPGLTFEWAGRAISRWEQIEFQLALLYSTFVGRPNNGKAVQEYGAGRIFRERLQLLRRRGEEYFMTQSDQALEADFKNICIAAEGFADRRNEVAQGVVSPSIFLPSFREDRLGNVDRWALAPPHFAVRNFNAEGFPKYAYTSRELNELVMRLGALQEQIEAFRAKLGAVR